MLFKRKNRRVIPRWRDFKTTLALGELHNSRDAEPLSPNDQEAVARRIAEFQVDRDIWHAADLLSSAFVVGDLKRASSQGISKYRAMADLYLAREELIASTPVAETAVNRALVEASKIEDKEVAFIAEQVRNLEANKRSRIPVAQVSASGAGPFLSK